MWRVMLHSFVVLPFLIAVSATLLYGAVLALTHSGLDAHRLLEDVRHGSTSKRWQSAYQLSLLLRADDPALRDATFLAAARLAFDDTSRERNPAARQFMALALGRTGNAVFFEPLTEALAGDPAENRPYLIHALGLLRDARAVPLLLPHLEDARSQVRLQTVIALGHIAQPGTAAALARMLEDPEPNVQWDAAVALAKLGDTRGKPVLLRLLDPAYLQHYTAVSPADRQHALITAVQAATLLKDPELDAAVTALAQPGVPMEVRHVALAARRDIQAVESAEH